MIEQRELLFKEPSKTVSDDIIAAQPTLKAALKLCKEVSGLNDDQICRELGIDPAHWSRVWSSKAHFPEDLFNPLMDLCGNEIPLRWQAMKRGYGLVRLKSSLELQLEDETKRRQKAEDELAVISNFMRQIGARLP